MTDSKYHTVHSSQSIIYTRYRTAVNGENSFTMKYRDRCRSLVLNVKMNASICIPVRRVINSNMDNQTKCSHSTHNTHRDTKNNNKNENEIKIGCFVGLMRRQEWKR